MKNKELIAVVLIITVLVSISIGYIITFILYKQYRVKTAYFDAHAQTALNKFDELENKLKNITKMVKQGKIERRHALEKIEGMQKDMEEWRDGYRTTLSDIRETLEDIKIDSLKTMVNNLQREINALKMTTQDLELLYVSGDSAEKNKANKEGVNLGKISVEKKEKENKK